MQYIRMGLAVAIAFAIGFGSGFGVRTKWPAHDFVNVRGVLFLDRTTGNVCTIKVNDSNVAVCPGTASQPAVSIAIQVKNDCQRIMPNVADDCEMLADRSYFGTAIDTTSLTPAPADNDPLSPDYVPLLLSRAGMDLRKTNLGMNFCSSDVLRNDFNQATPGSHIKDKTDCYTMLAQWPELPN